MHAYGHTKVGTGMPACAIEDQQDLFTWPRTDGVSELREGKCEGSDRNARQQQPPRSTGVWMDKGVEIAPLVAMLNNRLGALPPGAPDAPQDRLEADPVLIGRPQFHHVLGVGLLYRLDYDGKVFLKAACAAGSALAWRGRGTLDVQPKHR